VRDEESTGHWLGAVGYMILLDQVGKCFKPVRRLRSTLPNTIEVCLGYWASDQVSHEERCALYALRNALAHDYSLFNWNSRAQYQHLFTLDRHPTRLVAPAAREWSGDLADRSPECTTVVSLRAFGDLAERVVAALLAAAPDEVEIVLDGGADELLQRYGLLVPDPSSAPRFRCAIGPPTEISGGSFSGSVGAS